jgi:glycosyltransferase involved in cell wall biosynthesis
MASTLLRILLIHNFYGSSAPSGENQVFETEKNLLLQHGHEVEEFTRHSDEIRATGAIGIVKGALATPYNPFMARAIKKKVEQFKPDVVHVHNTFPLISPSIFSAIGQSAARVLTLHNYRLLCPAAIPMRDGKVCTACLDLRSVWPAIRHGCYRNSRIATLPLAANVALHRALGTWQHGVEAFIALTEFQRTTLVAAGLPGDKVYVKPNYFPGNPTVVPWPDRGTYAVFAGRLSAEKGVATLVKAWSSWGADAPELRIIGDGPLRGELEKAAAGTPIRFLGQLPADETIRQIAHGRLQLLPSEWFETFGLAIVEAFAVGTPAAVSNIGPLPSIVKYGMNGVVFEAANPQSLLTTVRNAWRTPGLLEQLGAGARQSFATLYTEDINYACLMDIYQQAIQRNAALKTL